MIKRKNIENFLKSKLSDPPEFGSGADPNASDLVPGKMILLSLGGGPGPSADYALDRVSLQVRITGEQSDYDSAESLALECDKALLSVGSSRSVDGVWVTRIARAGGRPSLIPQDDADRTNFTCNYIIEAEADLDE